MSKFTQELLKFLVKGKHTNASNPITAKRLAKQFKLPTNGTQPVMRKNIRTAIKEGLMILSNTKGYFLLNSEKEFNEYMDSLSSRAEKIIKRRNELIKNWNKTHKKSSRLKKSVR